jgi:NADPH2 dehydrogenase
MAESRLFMPVKLGDITLKQRVAMSPLTRYRADDSGVLLPIAKEYYSQRASVPGTLIVTEATYISKQDGGYRNAPGIYSQAQIDAWRQVVDAVHAKKSYIFLQLWSLGRVVDKAYAEQEGIIVKSSSAVPLDAGSDQSEAEPAIPKEMTVEDIKETIGNYAQAAKNAIEAGFDGVEIHGANSYLVDQFIQDTVNKRTDSYGGSTENRSRFAVEVAEAVVNAVGAERVGIRLSPFSTYQGMKMDNHKIIPQFADVVKKISKLNLAYLHLIESRVAGNADVEAQESLQPLVKLWPGPVLLAGGFTPDRARKAVDEEFKDRNNIIIVFGRYFLSTPDLLFRLKHGIPFNKYDRDTFYKVGSKDGYTDYPFSREFLESVESEKAQP